MEFQWENQTQKLQGIDTHSIQPASLKAISKEMQHGGSIFAICLQTTAKTTSDDVHPEMQPLLGKFEDIFQEPK